MTQPDIEAFWLQARLSLGPDALPEGVTDTVAPPTQSFGATPEQADELLDLILTGVKTGTACPLRDYELEGDPLPQVGDLCIVLDGAGLPRALIRTTDVRVVRFDQVTQEHADAEGEGDRTLGHWRAVHEWFFKEYDKHLRGFSAYMPVVCEVFEVVVTDRGE